MHLVVLLMALLKNGYGIRIYSVVGQVTSGDELAHMNSMWLLEQYVDRG